MPRIINLGYSYHYLWQLGIGSQKKMFMNRALIKEEWWMYEIW